MTTKKNALTLIEMMLVIILVGIVGGALAFNLKGAMHKGRQFKTEESKKKIDAVLSMTLMEGHSIEEVEHDWETYVRKSPLIKASKTGAICDGWNKPFQIKRSDDGLSLYVISENIDTTEEELF